MGRRCFARVPYFLTSSKRAGCLISIVNRPLGILNQPGSTRAPAGTQEWLNRSSPCLTWSSSTSRSKLPPPWRAAEPLAPLARAPVRSPSMITQIQLLVAASPILVDRSQSPTPHLSYPLFSLYFRSYS